MNVERAIERALARVYAATAVDTCARPRDVLKIRDRWAEEPA